MGTANTTKIVPETTYRQGRQRRVQRGDMRKDPPLNPLTPARLRLPRAYPPRAG